MSNVLRIKGKIRDTDVRIDIPDRIALFNPDAPEAHFRNYVKSLYGATKKDKSKKDHPRAHRNTLYYKGSSERTDSQLRLEHLSAMAHQAHYMRHETIFVQDTLGYSPWYIEPDDIYLLARHLGASEDDVIVVHYDEKHLHFHRLYPANHQSLHLLNSKD